MARDDDIERRLINWADWLAGLRSRGLGYGNPNLITERVDCEGYDAPSRNPVFDGEAEITDKAVRALQPDLQTTVALVYTGYDGSGKRTAQQYGIRAIATRLGISEATVHTRIASAHYKIRVWLSDRLVEEQAQRARNEAIRSAAKAARGF